MVSARSIAVLIAAGSIDRYCGCASSTTASAAVIVSAATDRLRELMRGRRVQPVYLRERDLLIRSP